MVEPDILPCNSIQMTAPFTTSAAILTLNPARSLIVANEDDTTTNSAITHPMSLMRSLAVKNGDVQRIYAKTPKISIIEC